MHVNKMSYEMSRGKHKEMNTRVEAIFGALLALYYILLNAIGDSGGLFWYFNGGGSAVVTRSFSGSLE